MRRGAISLQDLMPSGNANSTPRPRPMTVPQQMRTPPVVRYSGAFRATIENVIAAIQNEIDTSGAANVNILFREWNQIPNGQALSLVYQVNGVTTAMYMTLTGDPLLPITLYDKTIVSNVAPEEMPAILQQSGLNGYAMPKEVTPAQIPEVMKEG